LVKVQVPVVVGLGLDEAVRALTNAGLKQGTITRQASDSVLPDHVITSMPISGETVAREGAVDMVVSSGKELSTAPDLLGKNVKTAKEEIAKAGLTLGKVTYAYDDNRRGGVILKQTPAPRDTAEKGASIDIVVNEGD